jgi:CRISPR-associated protein Cmr5
MAGTARSLDQERAAFAWASVARAKQALRGSFDSYTNLAKSAPALIMGNGLMQTLAFLRQKSDEAKRLNEDLCRWLAKEVPSVEGENYPDVMKGLHGASSAEYLHATEEALEILRWIRQFAPTLKE